MTSPKCKLSRFLLQTIALLCVSSVLHAQFSSNDFVITTKGLSNEYASRFKDSSNKALLVAWFNQFRIPHDIVPIKIAVIYENSKGSVIAEINYNHEAIFAGNSDYNSHDQMMKRYGKGISVYLQNQIFDVLGEYIKGVATFGYQRDKDLLSFESGVKLKKNNYEWILFSAYNYFDSRGFFPHSFYSNAFISTGGKIYETAAVNPTILNDMKYFLVGKSKGLDGNKTAVYYFCQFFGMVTE